MAIIVFSQATAKHSSHARPPKGQYDPRQMMPRSKKVFLLNLVVERKEKKKGQAKSVKKKRISSVLTKQLSLKLIQRIFNLLK